MGGFSSCLSCYIFICTVLAGCSMVALNVLGNACFFLYFCWVFPIVCEYFHAMGVIMCRFPVGIVCNTLCGRCLGNISSLPGELNRECLSAEVEKGLCIRPSLVFVIGMMVISLLL